MPSNRRNLLAASGNGASLYVEDVFSTYLYTGNGSTQTITNGIDLAGEGGLVWVKGRSLGYANYLTDTERGAGKMLQSNGTFGEADNSPHGLYAFNSDGFSVSATTYDGYNNSGQTFASWTFRKAPKFFDVVTYTGTGSARTIAHDLGSVPGMIIVKRTDTTEGWQVYHRSLTSAAYKLVLNTSEAESSDSTAWNSTAPTSTVFSVGTNSTVNASGGTYVAYIYAHNAGGFGADGSEDIISCGSYTGPGTGGGAIWLGFEPQYLLIKRSTNADNWHIYDTQRGMIVTASGNAGNAVLRVDGTFDESSLATFGSVYPTATGFYIAPNSSSSVSASGQTFIYLAIRRPNKPPTSGTEVYGAVARSGTGVPVNVTTGVLSDLVIQKTRTPGGYGGVFFDRLRGAGKVLIPNNNSAESTESSTLTAFGMDSISLGSDVNSLAVNAGSTTAVFECLRRAPGFMDVVCYTGTGSAQTINHNLAAIPELTIFKTRSTAGAWVVFHAFGETEMARAYLDQTNAAITATYAAFGAGSISAKPTASAISLATGAGELNASGVTFVAYLFATLSGVSKVGIYTGNGSSQTINCGFAAGARFVLIKRTDATGDWYIWDTVRGIIAGNDPYLLLNSTAAEVTSTDYIDPYSAGFEISSAAPAAINASGGTFLFWAIA